MLAYAGLGCLLNNDSAGNRDRDGSINASNESNDNCDDSSVDNDCLIDWVFCIANPEFYVISYSAYCQKLCQ